MQVLEIRRPGEFATGCRADVATPGAGEVLVRVRRVGVCGTDYHAFRGSHPFVSYPRVLGHELGVEVIACGAEVGNVAVGDRCAVRPYLTCGRCVACRQGKSNCCTSLRCLGVHVDGGLCERLLLPAGALHPSRSLSCDELALVEPLAIGAHAVARAGVRSHDRVLVLGAGPIGLATAQFACVAGAHVTVADFHAARLAFCREVIGVAGTLDGRDDLLPQVAAVTDGDLADVVFDCTGNAQSMADSFRYVASGGRLTFVGLITGEVTFNDPEFHRRELTLLASRNATAADFDQAIGALEQGQVRVEPWMTHSCGVGEVTEQFARWMEPAAGVVKALIRMDERFEPLGIGPTKA